MFGLNLKDLRKQRGLSQGDIWENGLSSPSAEQLIHLSKLLDGLLGWISGRNVYEGYIELCRNFVIYTPSFVIFSG